MKNYRQLATILGGLTVLTAALFAQTPPVAASAAARGAAPAPVSPPVTPGAPSVVPPPAPMNPATPGTPVLVNPPVTPALPPVAPPAEPMKPAIPAVNPSPVVQADTTVTPATANSTTASTTGALNAPGGMNSLRLSVVDTNGDGKISSAEYTAYMSRTGAASTGATTKTPTSTTSASTSVSSNPAFLDLDTNHDGYLSQAEIDAGGIWKK